MQKQVVPTYVDTVLEKAILLVYWVKQGCIFNLQNQNLPTFVHSEEGCMSRTLTVRPSTIQGSLIVGRPFATHPSVSRHAKTEQSRRQMQLWPTSESSLSLNQQQIMNMEHRGNDTAYSNYSSTTVEPRNNEILQRNSRDYEIFSCPRRMPIGFNAFFSTKRWWTAIPQ